VVAAFFAFALFTQYWDDDRPLLALFMGIALVACLGNAYIVYRRR